MRSFLVPLVLLALGASACATMVSYGEERPAEPGSGESAWSKNRRSEFTVSVAHARAGGQ